MCNFVSPRLIMPPHTITFAFCFTTWKAGVTSHSCGPHMISFFGLGYWKRYLGHSSVNKMLSQSSAVSFACFLANLKRAFLCFSLNKGIFFRLKAFHPFLVMCLHTVMLETSMFFCWRYLAIFLVELPLLYFAFLIDFRAQLVETDGRPLLGLSLKHSLSTTCSPNVPSC